MIFSKLMGGGGMTPDRMIRIIEGMSDAMQVDGNVVEFEYRGVGITLIYDEHADRMRLISPVAQVADVDDDDLLRAMQANFHSVLDARYCMGNDILWSAFIHPLSDLSDALLESAVQQVAIARLSFGTDFTSGHLVFPG